MKFNKIQKVKNYKEEVIKAKIINSEGSVPRDAGNYMLISKEDIFGTIGGAAAGTVTQAMLGNHDGFQYIVNIDNIEADSAFVQGDSKAIPNGQKVIIVYGKDIRILPFIQ